MDGRCVSTPGFARWKRWPVSLNCKNIQIKEKLTTRIEGSYPAGGMDIFLLAMLIVSR
jgi:hypothetical protein